MYEFRLPDVGEGLHEAGIGRWLVQVGDSVGRDQPMVEIETDKALVEIPSPVAGTVVELRVPEGEVATVGTVIVVIEPVAKKAQVAQKAKKAQVGQKEPQEAKASPEAKTPQKGKMVAQMPSISEATPSSGSKTRSASSSAALSARARSVRQPGLAGPGKRVLAAPVVRKLALELGVELAQVKGSGPAGRILASDVHDFVAQSQAAASVAPAQPSSKGVSAGAARVLAAPAVRKMAWELGIELAQVPATGPEGRVLPQDVEQYVAQQQQETASAAESVAETTPAPAVSEPVAPIASKEGKEVVERVPLRGLRRRIAQRMEEAWRIPHVTSFEEIDATKLVALRQQLKAAAAQHEVHLTYLPLITKITLQVLKENPYFNATIDMEREEILMHHYYHIGIATAIPEGLLVPVIRHADQMSILEIARELSRLGELAQQRKLPPNELSGSTFTITNFGSFGGYMGTPIINPPEVAILGCGRITKKPVVIDDNIEIRSILPIALSYDHRLLDGAAAGKFLMRLRELIENPQQLLLELA